MVRFIRGTQRRRRDFWCLNEGSEGGGKSTTGTNMARAGNPKFSLGRDLIKDLDHLLDVLIEGDFYHVYVLDEAVNIFHNQDWNTWEARELTKLVRQMRIMRSFWILNIPDFEGVHPYVRNSRIRMRNWHPDAWDSDGIAYAPPMVLWKHKYFDFKRQENVIRWNRIIDELHVPCLDDDPEWEGYEEEKVQNFRDLAKNIRVRRLEEMEKKAKQAAKKKAKRPTKKPAAKPTPPILRIGGHSDEGDG